MPTLVGFNTFAALPEEEISEKISRRILSGDQGMLVWWSIGEGVHVEPHSHASEQIVWMLKGRMEFRLGMQGLCDSNSQLRSAMHQPAILFQPARASAVTVSMFLATTLQFTIGFASVPAIASTI